MRTTGCVECGIPDRLHEEIGAALAEAAPEPAVRTDHAREALARAPRVGPPRRRGKLLIAAATAAVLAGALLVLLPDEPVDPPEPVPAATVEEARDANTAALKSEAVRARLASAPKDAFALIAGGKLIGIERDIDKLLSAATEAAPDAPHRFLFRVGTEGDVEYRTITPIEAAVGMAFLRDAGLEFWEDPKKVEGLFKYDGTRLTAWFLVGTGSVLPTEREWEEAARPGGEVHREERAIHRWRIELAVVTGFDGPMLLPEDFDLDEPARWEIPGIATVSGGDGKKRVCRRILLSVGFRTNMGYGVLAEGLVPLVAHEPEILEVRVPWVRVPAGPFRFGATGSAQEYSLGAFEIMKYEVTNAQWWAYLKSEEERLRAAGKFEGAVPRSWGWTPASKVFPSPPAELKEKPVVSITWYEAEDFCREWLSRYARGVRLPYAYEWVKAARGPKDDRRYPWGTEFLDVRGLLKIPRANTRQTGLGRPADVGAFARTDISPYGVVGMGGNVSEFANFARFRADWPQPGFMGGSYLDLPDEASIHEKTRLARGSDHRWKFVGFRAARPVPD